MNRGQSDFGFTSDNGDFALLFADIFDCIILTRCSLPIPRGRMGTFLPRICCCCCRCSFFSSLSTIELVPLPNFDFISNAKSNRFRSVERQLVLLPLILFILLFVLV